MTARKRKSIDAAIRALFEQRAELRDCAALIAFAERLAARSNAA